MFVDTANLWLPVPAGTVQSCRLVATFIEVEEDLLRTEVLGGKPATWAGARHGRTGDPATPPWGADRQLLVCLRESELILTALDWGERSAPLFSSVARALRLLFLLRGGCDASDRGALCSLVCEGAWSIGVEMFGGVGCEAGWRAGRFQC